MLIPDQSSNEPFDEAVLEQIESKLKVKLPDSYVKLMKQWNGGYLEEEYTITALEYSGDLSYFLPEGEWILSEIFGISNSDDVMSIMSTPYMIQEWDLPQEIVLISGDGNTWVAFDYRDVKNDPPIIFIESTDKMTAKLANNFQDLLDRLVKYES